MQYGMMEVAGAARERPLRGLASDGTLRPPDLVIEAASRLSAGAGIVVHAGAQVYNAAEDTWFTLSRDTLAKLSIPGEYLIGGTWTDEEGVTRNVQITKGDWAVTWLEAAEMSNPTWPDAMVAPIGSTDHLGAATAFHQKGLAVGTSGPTPQPAGMSSGTKVAIGVGVAVAVVAVLWLLTKK